MLKTCKNRSLSYDINFINSFKITFKRNYFIVYSVVSRFLLFFNMPDRYYILRGRGNKGEIVIPMLSTMKVICYAFNCYSRRNLMKSRVHKQSQHRN